LVHCGWHYSRRVAIVQRRTDRLSESLVSSVGRTPHENKNQGLNTMRANLAGGNWLISPPGLLLVFGVVTGAIAWWLIALPVFNLSAAPRHAAHFPQVFVHAVGGTVMLFVGAANLYVGATRQFPRLHKPLGYAYLLGGTISAVSAILLAFSNAHSKPPLAFELDILKTSDAGWALASLGFAWLGVTAMAFRAARNKRFDSHQAWMIRSYVLVWAFVLCRLVAKVPSFPELGAGAAMIWLSWIVPLFVCEMVLQWPAGRRQSRAATAM
jgi:hypothetical protein